MNYDNPNDVDFAGEDIVSIDSSYNLYPSRELLRQLLPESLSKDAGYENLDEMLDNDDFQYETYFNPEEEGEDAGLYFRILENHQDNDMQYDTLQISLNENSQESLRNLVSEYETAKEAKAERETQAAIGR